MLVPQSPVRSRNAFRLGTNGSSPASTCSRRILFCAARELDPPIARNAQWISSRFSSAWRTFLSMVKRYSSLIRELETSPPISMSTKSADFSTTVSGVCSMRDFPT